MRHVITLLGVASALSSCKSTDSFNEYKAKSMAAEARVMVQSMARGVESAFNNERIGADGLMAKQALPG